MPAITLKISYLAVVEEIVVFIEDRTFSSSL
jgi:hypothetical protein